MEYYGIECKGEFNLQRVSELPSFDSSRDEGRLVYNTQDGKLYVGNDVDGEWSGLSKVDEIITDHNNLNNISSDDHHSRYTDSEAIDAVKGVIANPGYAIYFTNTNQKRTPGYVTFDSGEKDSYNVDGRISQPHNNRIRLQAGYYIISYLAAFLHTPANTTPDVWARIYDRTNGNSLYWTQTKHELWDHHQRCTISFSFPWYISSQTDISLQVSTNSSQPAELEQATLAIHAVY